MKNYKRLLMYIRPYLKRLGIAIVCIILAAGANLYVPWIIKDMIDKVLAQRDMLMKAESPIPIYVVSVEVTFLSGDREFKATLQKNLKEYVRKG